MECPMEKQQHDVYILLYGMLNSFTSDLFINFAIALYTYTVFYAQFITHQDMHLNKIQLLFRPFS